MNCLGKTDKLLGFYCPDTEGLWKVSAQSEFWFPIQLPPPQTKKKKKLVNFLQADKKTKISNFIGLFCVKDKLLGQKTERAVYCPDTEGLLKVSAQSEWWFPIQPPKIGWISFEQARMSKFQIIGWFCLKDKLLEQNFDTAVSCPDTEGLWKVSAKSESWFPIQHTQKWWNFFKQARRSKFQILLVGFV